jgi:general secretion pathway protein H
VTLVELLVVIVILALASAVVLLTAPPSRPPVRDDAERFAARVQLALDDAITSAQPMRVTLDAQGYVFETLGADGWAPVATDKAFIRRNFDSGTTATPEIEDAANDNARALGVEEESGEEEEAEEEEGAYSIPLDPLGAQTAFSVRFSSGDGVWVVSVDQGAAVSVKENG